MSKKLFLLVGILAAFLMVAPVAFAGNGDDSPSTVVGDKNDVVNNTDVNGNGMILIDSTIGGDTTVSPEVTVSPTINTTVSPEIKTTVSPTINTTVKPEIDNTNLNMNCDTNNFEVEKGAITVSPTINNADTNNVTVKPEINTTDINLIGVDADANAEIKNSGNSAIIDSGNSSSKSDADAAVIGSGNSFSVSGSESEVENSGNSHVKVNVEDNSTMIIEDSPEYLAADTYGPAETLDVNDEASRREGIPTHAILLADFPTKITMSMVEGVSYRGINISEEYIGGEEKYLSLASLLKNDDGEVYARIWVTTENLSVADIEKLAKVDTKKNKLSLAADLELSIKDKKVDDVSPLRLILVGGKEALDHHISDIVFVVEEDKLVVTKTLAGGIAVFTSNFIGSTAGSSGTGVTITDAKGRTIFVPAVRALFFIESAKNKAS